MADKLVTFDYDKAGRYVTITRYASLDGSQFVAASDYRYDQYGRPISLVHHQPQTAQRTPHPSGSPTAHGQLTTDRGQLTTDRGQLTTDNPLAAYNWTGKGGGDTVEVVHVGAASGPQFGAGWMLPFGGTVHTSRELEINPLPNYVWTFDTAFIGHLVQTTSTNGTVDYQYDPGGQLLSADYTAEAGLPDTAGSDLSTTVGAGLSTSAGAGLLTIAPDTSAGAGLPTVPPDELYTHDANGNRTNPGYVTGDHNRLLSDGTYDYEYDAEGNRTRRTEIATGEVTEYHWDHRNRLVRVTTRTTDNGPLTTDTSYAYDYLNRWIARTHDPDGDGPLGFTNTYFVYDGTPPSGSLLDRAAVTTENIGQIVLHFEADGQGDPQLAHRYLWGPAIDQILADEQVTDPTAPGNVVWPLTDHLNTVRDLAVYDADSDTTTIVNHLIYDAYGRITSQSDPDQTTLFAFAARPFDPATGLQNNLNRWYDAEVGLWISEDPIGFEGRDANLARYIGNKPTSATDPSGLVNPNTGTEADWGARMPPPPGVRRTSPREPRTPDELRLVELCNGDPAQIKKIKALLGVLDSTGLFPIAPNRCHAWVDLFLELYDELPNDERFLNLTYEIPLYVGWVPFWWDHGVVTFELNGTTVYLDRRLQGGADRISFEPHRHLIYKGDPRYDEELKRRRRARFGPVENPYGVFPKPGACFAAGTLVQCKGAWRPIELIRPGDRVLGWDVRGSRLKETTVQARDAHIGQFNVMRLEMRDAEVLEVTSDHPFFNGQTWMSAAELAAGGNVMNASGETLSIAAGDHVRVMTKVYNLRTKCGTYLVGRAGVVVSGMVRELPGERDDR